MILTMFILRWVFSEDESDDVHWPADLAEPVTRQVQSFWRVCPDVVLGVGELTSLGPLAQWWHHQHQQHPDIIIVIRITLNQSCWSLLWLGTKSRSSLSPSLAKVGQASYWP